MEIKGVEDGNFINEYLRFLCFEQYEEQCHQRIVLLRDLFATEQRQDRAGLFRIFRPEQRFFCLCDLQSKEFDLVQFAHFHDLDLRKNEFVDFQLLPDLQQDPLKFDHPLVGRQQFRQQIGDCQEHRLLGALRKNSSPF